MKLVIILAALAALVPASQALKCLALSNNGTVHYCTGATYCIAAWRKKGGSMWKVSSLGCVQSTVQHIQYMNKWRHPTANQALFRCNFRDFCNSKPPPMPLPTAPPLLQCQLTTPNGTASCYGTACIIEIASQQMFQLCDSDGSAFASVPPGVGQVCSQFYQNVQTQSGSNVAQGVYCVCRNGPNCNTQGLLEWGLRNRQPPATTCSSGSGNPPIAAQYCGWTTLKSPNTQISVAYSLNSTLSTSVIPFGCSRIYGSLAAQTAITSCVCNSNNCNTPNVVPTAWPTPPPPMTMSTPTWKPWTTWHHLSTMKPHMPTVLMVLLEKFDNTAGGGQLFMKGRCDPFWFSGLDQCDMAIQVCVEPLNSDPAMLGCITKWIDLGQVTNNNNKALFNPGASYGGWTNPMTYPALPFIMARGFQVKYAVTDVDNGGRQLIDINICNVYLSKFAPVATISCQHQRPNGYPALLRLSYYVSMGHGPGPHPSPSHPTWYPTWSQRPSWRPSPPWTPRPSWRPSGRPSFLADFEHEFNGFMPKIHA